MFAAGSTVVPAGLVELRPAEQRAIRGGWSGLASRLLEIVFKDLVDNYKCFARGFREGYQG